MANLLYLMGFFEPPPVGSVQHAEKKHVTLLPAFDLPDAQLPSWQRYLSSFAPWWSLELEAGPQARFGERGEYQVSVLQGASVGTLRELHLSLLDQLSCHRGSLAQPQYAAERYCPHVSDWDAPAGTRVRLTHLSLIHHRGGFKMDMWNLGNYALS